jgi:hypothetical protein
VVGITETLGRHQPKQLVDIAEIGTPPKLPIQTSILNSLGNVPELDVVFAGEVGDGAGELEDAVVGAG